MLDQFEFYKVDTFEKTTTKIMNLVINLGYTIDLFELNIFFIFFIYLK